MLQSESWKKVNIDSAPHKMGGFWVLCSPGWHQIYYVDKNSLECLILLPWSPNSLNGRHNSMPGTAFKILLIIIFSSFCVCCLYMYVPRCMCVPMCMGVCSYVYVCVLMYVCVCEFLCVYVFAACGYQKYLLYIISKAGTKLIGILLPLPPVCCWYSRCTPPYLV